MATEDVIASAIASARDEGVFDEGGSDEGETTETGEETSQEGDETPTGDDTGDEGGTGDEEESGETTDDGEGEGETGEEDESEEVDDDPLSEKNIAKELGIDPKHNNRLPYHRIVKTVPNMVRKAMQPVMNGVATALGLDATKLTPQTFVSSVNTAMRDVGKWRDRSAFMDEIAPLMESDGEGYVRLLAKANPEQYQKFVDFLEGNVEVQGGGGELPDAKNDPKPLPDVEIDLPNGQKGKTYSQEQYDKLMEWNLREAERRVSAKYEKRLKPIEDERKTKQQREESQREREQRVGEVLQEAESYPLFKEHKAEIQAALKDFPNLKAGPALRAAYMKVVVGKLRVSYNEMRKKVLAELKKTPTKVGAGGGTANNTKRDGEAPVRGEDGTPVSGTEAAIRRSIAKAKAAGLK